MAKKYELRSEKADETLNLPVHKYINLGNLLIGLLIFGFVMFIVVYKVPLISNEVCYMRDIVEEGDIMKATIQIQDTSFKKKIGVPIVIMDYQSKDEICTATVDSVNQKLGLLYCHANRLDSTISKSLISSKSHFKSIRIKNHDLSIITLFFRNFSSN